jgi:hypothetical protein
MTREGMGKEWTLAENEAQGEWALPDGWVRTTLGEACVIVLGQSPPSSTYNAEGSGVPIPTRSPKLVMF